MTRQILLFSRALNLFPCFPRPGLHFASPHLLILQLPSMVEQFSVFVVYWLPSTFMQRISIPLDEIPYLLATVISRDDFLEMNSLDGKLLVLRMYRLNS
jgi:hypothetical protein